MKKSRLTTWIVIGMVLGILVGYACNQFIHDAQTLKSVAGYFALVTDLFLRLIKMIVAPLVATNVLGNSIASAVVTKWEGQLGTELTEAEFAAISAESERQDRSSLPEHRGTVVSA